MYIQSASAIFLAWKITKNISLYRAILRWQHLCACMCVTHEIKGTVERPCRDIIILYTYSACACVYDVRRWWCCGLPRVLCVKYNILLLLFNVARHEMNERQRRGEVERGGKKGATQKRGSRRVAYYNE